MALLAALVHAGMGVPSGWGQEPDFAGALGYPEFAWTGSGWTVLPDGFDGAYAEGSVYGGIQGAVARLEATVVGPGELRFWWRSRPPAPYMFATFIAGSVQFSVDGVGKLSGSGDPATSWAEFAVAIPSGSHRLDWSAYQGQAYFPCIDDPQLNPWGLYCPNGHWEGTPSPGFHLDRVTWVPARGFHRWIGERGLSAAPAAAAADPDGDGSENLLEYVFGTSPTAAAAKATPDLHRLPQQVEFRFPLNPDAGDVELVVEYAAALGGPWTAAATRGAAATSWLNNGAILVDTQSIPGSVIVVLSGHATPARYLRLRARLP